MSVILVTRERGAKLSYGGRYYYGSRTSIHIYIYVK